MNGSFVNILQQVQQGQTARMEFPLGQHLYIRLFQPRERLILLGGGHISAALCSVGASLNFEVIVVEDRPEYADCTRFPGAARVICGGYQSVLHQLELGNRDYVALLTRGHRYDAECLRAILAGDEPRYVGMIGSRNRVAALLGLLRDEGQDIQRLMHVHAPIGLPINAQTPQEIAISIAAELIQCRRNGLPRRSHSMVLTNQDTNQSLLTFLARDSTPKAAVLVCDTGGSTPVKSGALLAVNEVGRVEGTVGGGYWENRAILEAKTLIGTGTKKVLTVRLEDEIGVGDGMACGGYMQLYIWDVPQDA